MRRRRWALPTLVAALAGLVVGALVIEGDDRAEAQRAARLAAAERTVVYTVTPAGGPRFRLFGGAETVLLVAHLELPDEPYTPDRTYRFALVATLRGPDGALIQRWTLSRRTRQTKAGEGSDGWGYEAAFVPDGRIQVTDGAAIELQLPAAPPRSTLELRLSEETGLLGADDRTLVAAFADPRALVRVYRQVEVDAAEAEVQARGEGKGAGSRRLATYLPWHALDGAMRRRSVAAGWERLIAEGHTGEDYEIQGIYVAAARPTGLPAGLEPAIAVADGQPAIVHLQGPATVTVRGRLPATAGAGAALTVQPRWLGPLREPGPPAAAGDGDGGGGTAAGPQGQDPKDMSLRPESSDDPALAGDLALDQERRLELAADGAWRELTLAIPRGWTSLEVATGAAAAELQVLTDEPGRHVGADPHRHHRRADGRPFVPVDLRSAPLYVVGAAASPIVVDLGGPADVYARVIRVDARAVGEPHPLPLRVEFLDREGRVIGAVDETLAPTDPAPYERLRPLGLRPPGAAVADLLRAAAADPGDPGPAGGPGPDGPVDDAARPDEDEEALAAEPHAGDAATSALGFPLGVAPVSEPASLRLIAPRAAVQARIRGQAPALVAVRGLLPPADEPASGPPWIWPYDQVVHGDERWRFAPLRRGRWFPIEAVDHQGRVDRGEVMLLHGQIRREASEPARRAQGPWEALHPAGRHPRREVLERVSAEQRAQAIARWAPGTYTALRRGAAVALDLGPAGPRPPTLWTQVTGDAARLLGEEIALRTDDHELRWRIRGRTERRPLPTAGGRRSTLTWTEGPRGVVLLVDRPPRSPAPIYRRRQLHRLGAGGLTVTVDKESAAKVVLNLVIYWFGAPPSQPTELRVALDGGAPRRRTLAATSRFTAAARTLEAAPTEQVALLHQDRRGEGRAHVLRAVVALGDDVAPGRHTVHVSHVGGPPVWLRFFRQGDDPPPARAWQWQERRDGLLVEVSDAWDE